MATTAFHYPGEDSGMPRAVVALGGNALLGADESATVENQRQHARETVQSLQVLRDQGYELALTHGNGPQVGTLLLEQEDAEGVPEYPLDVLVAETQAQVGYIIASEFDRAFETTSASLVTRVLVDPDDPAFEEPSKPIGPYYDDAEAAAPARAEGAASGEFEMRAVTTPAGESAYRRVVPSPRPTQVLEADHIRSLVESSATVVCGGGGGVPVSSGENDGLHGVAAVVDKDYTSRLIAEDIDAELLVMITDVPCAYENFGTADQEPLRELSPSRVRELLDAGTFGEGSMAPKMRACARFVEGTGGTAVICDESNLAEALTDDAGTTITAKPSS